MSKSLCLWSLSVGPLCKRPCSDLPNPDSIERETPTTDRFISKRFYRALISASLGLMMIGSANCQDTFSGYSTNFRTFLTGHAVKELKAAHPSSLIDQAEANLSSGKHAEAISNFKEFLAQNSDRRQKIVYSLDLADALQRMGNRLAAETVCDDVTNELFAIPDAETNEETLNFLNCLGAFYRHSGDMEKAKRCFYEVLELCQKQTNTGVLQKSIGVQRAEQELLRLFLKEKNFDEALPLAKRFPPEIKVHSTGFDLSIGRATCGEGFGSWFGPKGNIVKSSELLAYQRGVKKLNQRALAEAEREFLQSSRPGADPGVRRASLIALCETYRQWGKPRKSVVALSDYFQIALNPAF